MSSAPTPQLIAADAAWLAQAFDPGAGLVRLIEMTPEAYRSASFLDDRILQQPVNAHLMPWAEVAAALGPDSRRDARWIFHIGHVGSTLVSRLLGELEQVLAIREPRLLRDFASVDPASRAALAPKIQALLSRTFSPEQTAVVKATSFVSEVAAELLPADGKALFLFAAPRTYVEGILAGENSCKEARMLAPLRAQRMHGRVGELPGAGASDAHLAAAAWACEMTALEAAAERIGAQGVLWADFDQMLGDMAGALASLVAFFGVRAPEGRLREIVSGPLMQRYSKALEYDYSPTLRRELLAQARREHGRQIDSASAMLEQAAAGSPLLARALGRAEET